MKFNSLALGAVCASVLFAGSAFAQQPVAAPVQVLDAAGHAAATTMVATVAAVDAKNRVVTLKGESGNEFAVQVGKSVKLSNIQPGDAVDATYVQATALDFQTGDGIRMAKKTLSGDGGNGMKRTTVISNVWAVDRANGDVTVLGPFGHLSAVHLRDPADLNGVKVGDQMKITYTQAIATAIVKKS
ncbi:hypothetical protein [Variovorax sp.]|uniref:hypothetical protein n=1 Tax=Variovorax sp. TaxID=1871043 RepID=UPI002D62DA1B|nr:hypothetical protein [Variovorax sp.]HYP84154.1 hypothetical protein [Variovorax sp.]